MRTTEGMKLMLEIEKLVEKNGKGEFVLAGEDGNAFAIMGRVRQGLRNADWPSNEVTQVLTEMTAGDYNHLLLVALTVQGAD